jgi:hypothetical protein
MNSEVCELRPREERILATFTRRLIEIAVLAGARGSDSSPTAAFNALRLPAIALDRHGFVVDVNAAADMVFDRYIKVKDRRLFIRDPDSQRLLKEAIDKLKTLPWVNPLVFEPVIVPRTDQPVIVRIWPLEGPARPPAQEVRALLTLNALGPRPEPPAADLAKTFRLTPAEAKLACIIARGASPYIAAKTDTDRDGELSCFNSLDAQREACEAYTKSQAHDLTSLIRLSCLAPDIARAG